MFFIINLFLLLLQIEASKLFSNVEEIYEVNLAFWTEHLSKVIENVSLLLVVVFDFCNEQCKKNVVVLRNMYTFYR